MGEFEISVEFVGKIDIFRIPGPCSDKTVSFAGRADFSPSLRLRPPRAGGGEFWRRTIFDATQRPNRLLEDRNDRPQKVEEVWWFENSRGIWNVGN